MLAMGPCTHMARKANGKAAGKQGEVGATSWESCPGGLDQLSHGVWVPLGALTSLPRKWQVPHWAMTSPAHPAGEGVKQGDGENPRTPSAPMPL